MPADDIKFLLRIPVELHGEVVGEAEKREQSLNLTVCTLLREGLRNGTGGKVEAAVQATRRGDGEVAGSAGGSESVGVTSRVGIPKTHRNRPTDSGHRDQGRVGKFCAGCKLPMKDCGRVWRCQHCRGEVKK